MFERKILYTDIMQLIINIDGGSRGNPGPGASGCVIKDRNGKLLKSEGLFFRECTNNQAEFNALKLALKNAKELGGEELFIRADSQLLVKQYLGEYKIKNPQLQMLMSEIKNLASGFKKINIKHVPREQNKEADLICNQTMDKALKKLSAPAKPIYNHLAEHSESKAEALSKAKPRNSDKIAKEPEQLELFDLNNL